MQLDRVVYDSRFAQSRLFGAVNAGAGYRTAGFRGDITALWFKDLGPAWAAGGGAVAGMTTEPRSFCLEQLAKDHWKRVVLRVDPPPRCAGDRARFLGHSLAAGKITNEITPRGQPGRFCVRHRSP